MPTVMHYCLPIGQFVNKKYELMLMRRARAYSTSCSQVILAYRHLFCRNSLFCGQKSPKITKTPIFKVQGHLRSSMLIPIKSTSLVLVIDIDDKMFKAH